MQALMRHGYDLEVHYRRLAINSKYRYPRHVEAFSREFMSRRFSVVLKLTVPVEDSQVCYARSGSFTTKVLKISAASSNP